MIKVEIRRDTLRDSREMTTAISRYFSRPYFGTSLMSAVVVTVGFFGLGFPEFVPSNKVRIVALAAAALIAIASYIVLCRDQARDVEQPKNKNKVLWQRVGAVTFSLWFGYNGAVTLIPQHLATLTGAATQIGALGEKFITPRHAAGCQTGILVRDGSNVYRHCIAESTVRRLPKGCWNVTAHLTESAYGNVLRDVDYGEPMRDANGEVRSSCL